ncbi:MAG: LysE family transporter [Caulobacteraceae bacterium]
MLGPPTWPGSASTSSLSPANTSPRYGRGLGTNLLNPKCGVFYVSFLPMFVPHGWPVGATLFGLCLAHVIMSFAWLAFVAVATAPLGRLLARPGVAKWLDRATGSVFLAFGAKLALDDGR